MNTPRDCKCKCGVYLCNASDLVLTPNGDAMLKSDKIEQFLKVRLLVHNITYKNVERVRIRGSAFRLNCRGDETCHETIATITERNRLFNVVFEPGKVKGMFIHMLDLIYSSLHEWFVRL